MQLAGPLTGPTHVDFGRFGALPVYRPLWEPDRVVLLLSADRWTDSEADAARALALRGALVVGVDTVAYLEAARQSTAECVYAAADLEALSQFVQKRAGIARYSPPVLAGLGRGGVVAYAALAQSPPDTFAAGVSVDFCPLLEGSKRFCHGTGLRWEEPWQADAHLLPDLQLENPWWAVPAGQPKPCPETQLRPFSNPMAMSSAAAAPGRSPAAARLSLLDGVDRVAVHPGGPAGSALPGPVADLPLLEFPHPQAPTDLLVVIISGDGGWVGLDRKLGQSLRQRHVPVVGVDSLQYFWRARQPAEAARDLERLLRHYLADWGRRRVLLIGYSQGADVLPFMVAGLPGDLRARVALVALIGPDGSASFDMNLNGWMTEREAAPDLPVLPELDRLRGLKVLCVYGKEERESMCRRLTPGRFDLLETQGGHGFRGDAGELADVFLQKVGVKTPPPAREPR